MDSPWGDDLTRWSIRLAVACYLGRVFVDLRPGTRCTKRGAKRKARWLWTCGCMLYIVHVACAFGFYHQWSHAVAYRHTAEQTAAATGIRWGGGLYLNYAFTALWLADLALWWRHGIDSPYRSRVYFWMLHSLFAFMMINATVVFGPPVWKPIAVIAAVCMAVLVRRHRTAA